MPLGVVAQQSTSAVDTVQAGAHYDAGSFKRTILGFDYRDLWTAQIEVPVFRPDTFAGGLEALQRGGGRQTVSLRFGAKDGREFVFRSVDKDQGGGLHEDLQDTWIDDVVQDQMSSKHPGAALVVAPLLAAAGVLHAIPTLERMADDPSLGEFREEFAGMLGIFEARPTETDGVGRFRDFESVVGTPRLIERISESAKDRVDAPAYLAARLMDLLIGDWDRHADQWRWAEVSRNDIRYWLPIPRDRDNAFFALDGLIGSVGRAVRPFAVRYGDDYSEIHGLTYNARGLDRRVLPQLSRAEWDSVALDLQSRITDAVIANAVAHLPRPYFDLSAAQLEANLRARRDLLDEAAGVFYSQLAHEADLYGTDEADVAEIERREDGSVAIRVSSKELGTFVDRVFDPSETREVRLYLLAGDDSATVSGAGEGRINVRVVGGDDDDHLENAATTRSATTAFYDDDGDNVLIPGRGAVIDQRSYAPPALDTLTQNNLPPPRDWGSSFTTLAPGFDWRSEIGPVLSLGPVWTRFGFRRLPYASQTEIQLQYAPLHNRFGVAAEHHSVWTGGDRESLISVTASKIGSARFHGYGNETAEGDDPDISRVWATEFAGSAMFTQAIGGRSRFSFGPVAAFLQPAAEDQSAASAGDLPGGSDYGIAGFRGGATLDRRDSPSYPRRGVHVTLSSAWYPIAWNGASDPFVKTDVAAAAYFPLPFPLEATLAVRGGGSTLWGVAPFQFAPSVGGGSTLRGHRNDRFRGDASLYGGAEVRTALGRADLMLIKGDIGAIVLADAGRVFVATESSDRWHSAYGGGVWFGPIDREYTVHLLIAQGESLRFSAGIGVPY